MEQHFLLQGVVGEIYGSGINIVDVDIETQYSRMDIEKFEDILRYAEKTRYERQYLWGAEWWYWLQDKGHPEMWDRGKDIRSAS